MDTIKGTIEKLDCGHPESDHSPITRGYAKTADDRLVCWDCAAMGEREFMQSNGRTTLYLVKQDGHWFVTDWTGKVSYRTEYVKRGYHNIGGTRMDAWFYDEKGNLWWGVHYGEFNQIIHCKRINRSHIVQ